MIFSLSSNENKTKKRQIFLPILTKQYRVGVQQTEYFLMTPSSHDWKIVDWDVKPQHKQTIL